MQFVLDGYKCLKLKLRVFLADHIVAMVTYCATKLTATCSSMIGQFVDTMMLAWKFDVLKTNIYPRSEASRANMLVLRTSNFQGATIRPIVSRHKHLFLAIVHH